VPRRWLSWLHFIIEAVEHWEKLFTSSWCTNGKEPNGHGKCYICSCTVAGFPSKNRQTIQYPHLPSAIWPVPHGPGIPIPLPPRYLETVDDSISEESLSDSQMTECSEYECKQQPKLFTQAELNDLVRDMNLPKHSALIQGARSKEKRMLSSVTTFLGTTTARGNTLIVSTVRTP